MLKKPTAKFKKTLRYQNRVHAIIRITALSAFYSVFVQNSKQFVWGDCNFGLVICLVPARPG
jgi:hypothetical protein